MKKRDLIVLDLVAVGIIIIAIAVKVSELFPIDLAIPLPSQLNQPLVTEKSFYEQPKPEIVKPTEPISPITARAYLVGNVNTGKVYIEKNSKLVLPVASMSKLITAFAATDQYKLNQPITISEASMRVASDTAKLMAGEKFTLEELLYPMLLNSSNVAAEAIASATDRAGFLELMSSYAWEVGMPSTYFADPSGLSPQNRSTAADFFALARYLFKSRSDILKITQTLKAQAATTSDHHAHNFTNIHPFVTNPNFLGGKTGHTTEARDTMLSIINVGGEPIAIIVLASDNRQKDTAYLLSQVTSLVSR